MNDNIENDDATKKLFLYSYNKHKMYTYKLMKRYDLSKE